LLIALTIITVQLGPAGISNPTLIIKIGKWVTG